MSILFELPEDVYKSLTNSWLEIGCLVRLDSAVCGNYRNYFIRMAEFMVYDNVRSGSYDFDGKYDWIHIRKVKLVGVRIHGGICQPNGELMIPVSTAHLERLEIECEWDPDIRLELNITLNSFIFSCPLLRVLIVKSVNSMHLLDHAVLKQLEELHISDGEQISSVLVNNIRYCCRKLIVLHLSIAIDDSAHFLDILRFNPLLKSVCFCCNQALLEDIFQICQHIDSIELKVPQVDLISIKNALIFKPDMKKLCCESMWHNFEYTVVKECKTVRLQYSFEAFQTNELQELLSVISGVTTFEYCSYIHWTAFPLLILDWSKTQGKSLTTMDVSGVSSSSMSELLSNCPFVSDLTWSVDETGFIDTLCKLVGKLKKLLLRSGRSMSHEEVIRVLKSGSSLCSANLSFQADEKDTFDWRSPKCLDAAAHISNLFVYRKSPECKFDAYLKFEHGMRVGW